MLLFWAKSRFKAATEECFTNPNPQISGKNCLRSLFCSFWMWCCGLCDKSIINHCCVFPLFPSVLSEPNNFHPSACHRASAFLAFCLSCEIIHSQTYLGDQFSSVKWKHQISKMQIWHIRAEWWQMQPGYSVCQLTKMFDRLIVLVAEVKFILEVHRE